MRPVIAKTTVTVRGRTYVPGAKFFVTAAELATLGDTVERISGRTRIQTRDRVVHEAGIKRG